MNEKLRVLSLFSGVGAFEEALNNINVDFNLINYCEFQDYIAKSYSLIHKVDETNNLGDITKVDETKLNDFDLMTYGFPCQDISALGDQKGLFDEEGYRTLTDGEMFAFQGFKKEYGRLLRDNGITTSQIGYMLGNSITVTVLEDILKNLLKDYM